MLAQWGIVPSGPLNWNAVFDEQIPSSSSYSRDDSDPVVNNEMNKKEERTPKGKGITFAPPIKMGKRKSRGEAVDTEDSFRESMKKKKKTKRPSVFFLFSMIRLHFLLLAGLSAAQWNPNYNRYMAYNAVGYNNGAYPQTDYSGYKGNPDPVPQSFYQPDPPRPEFESNNGYDVIFTVAPPIPVAITNPHPSRISRGSTTPPPPPPSSSPSPSTPTSTSLPWWENEDTTTTQFPWWLTSPVTSPSTTRSTTQRSTTHRPSTTGITQWWTKKTEKPRPTPTWSTIQWWVATSTRPTPSTTKTTTTESPTTTTTERTTTTSTTTTTESPVIVREVITHAPSTTPSTLPSTPSLTRRTLPHESTIQWWKATTIRTPKKKMKRIDEGREWTKREETTTRIIPSSTTSSTVITPSTTRQSAGFEWWNAVTQRVTRPSTSPPFQWWAIPHSSTSHRMRTHTTSTISPSTSISSSISHERRTRPFTQSIPQWWRKRTTEEIESTTERITPITNTNTQRTTRAPETTTIPEEYVTEEYDEETTKVPSTTTEEPTTTPELIQFKTTQFKNTEVIVEVKEKKESEGDDGDVIDSSSEMKELYEEVDETLTSTQGWTTIEPSTTTESPPSTITVTPLLSSIPPSTSSLPSITSEWSSSSVPLPSSIPHSTPTHFTLPSLATESPRFVKIHLPFKRHSPLPFDHLIHLFATPSPHSLPPSSSSPSPPSITTVENECASDMTPLHVCVTSTQSPTTTTTDEPSSSTTTEQPVTVTIEVTKTIKHKKKTPKPAPLGNFNGNPLMFGVQKKTTPSTTTTTESTTTERMTNVPTTTVTVPVPSTTTSRPLPPSPSPSTTVNVITNPPITRTPLPQTTPSSPVTRGRISTTTEEVIEVKETTLPPRPSTSLPTTERTHHHSPRAITFAPQTDRPTTRIFPTTKWTTTTPNIDSFPTRVPTVIVPEATRFIVHSTRERNTQSPSTVSITHPTTTTVPTTEWTTTTEESIDRSTTIPPLPPIDHSSSPSPTLIPISPEDFDFELAATTTEQTGTRQIEVELRSNEKEEEKTPFAPPPDDFILPPEEKSTEFYVVDFDPIESLFTTTQKEEETTTNERVETTRESRTKILPIPSVKTTQPPKSTITETPIERSHSEPKTTDHSANHLLIPYGPESTTESTTTSTTSSPLSPRSSTRKSVKDRRKNVPKRAALSHALFSPAPIRTTMTRMRNETASTVSSPITHPPPSTPSLYQHATIPRIRVSVEAANVVNEEGDKEGPVGLSMKRKKIIKPFAASTTARTITMKPEKKCCPCCAENLELEYPSDALWTPQLENDKESSQSIPHPTVHMKTVPRWIPPRDTDYLYDEHLTVITEKEKEEDLQSQRAHFYPERIQMGKMQFEREEGKRMYIAHPTLSPINTPSSTARPARHSVSPMIVSATFAPIAHTNPPQYVVNFYEQQQIPLRQPPPPPQSYIPQTHPYYAPPPPPPCPCAVQQTKPCCELKPCCRSVPMCPPPVPRSCCQPQQQLCCQPNVFEQMMAPARQLFGSLYAPPA
ncbi:hypothetical protein PRIPAC_84793, partial [Pristionchus pacificus]